MKPARGWGGALVLMFLIERDSCLHHPTAAKETALGENNNKKSPNPQNTKYIQHLLPRANVWQELSRLQDTRTAGQKVSTPSGRRPPFHSARKGCRSQRRVWCKSGASSCAKTVGKELETGSGPSGGQADGCSWMRRFVTLVTQRGAPGR